MNPEREESLRLDVLRILNQCAGYLLPDPTLKNQIRLTVVPPPTTSEMEATIRFLDDHHYINGIRPELGGPVKWKITDYGAALLAEKP